MSLALQHDEAAGKSATGNRTRSPTLAVGYLRLAGYDARLSNRTRSPTLAVGSLRLAGYDASPTAFDPPRLPWGTSG
jgi:hypothetical protein